jgi:hypothetical protein
MKKIHCHCSSTRFTCAIPEHKGTNKVKKHNSFGKYVCAGLIVTRSMGEVSQTALRMCSTNPPSVPRGFSTVLMHVATVSPVYCNFEQTSLILFALAFHCQHHSRYFFPCHQRLFVNSTHTQNQSVNNIKVTHMIVRISPFCSVASRGVAHVSWL